MTCSSPIRALVATLAVALGTLALPGGAGAVVRGVAVEDGEYPWTVAITSRGFAPSDGQFCGGTIVGLDRILTAAHCIDPGGENQATADSIDVVVGQAALCAGRLPSSACPASETSRAVGITRHVRQISLHPRVDIVADGGPTEHYFYDLAVLTLTEPLPATYASAVVAPVASSGENQLDSATAYDAWGAETATVDGTDAFVAGWGATDYGDGSVNVLRFGGGIGLERLDDGVCADRYPGAWGFRAQDMLCAGVLDTASLSAVDSCQGDSGGPLLKRAFHDDYPVLPKADARTWAEAEYAGLPDDAARADAAARALATTDLALRARIAARRAEKRAEFTDEQRAGWEQAIRDGLTPSEQALPPEEREQLVADLLEAKIAFEADRFVGPEAAQGYGDVFGGLYLERRVRERALQAASYLHEARHWRLLGVVSWGEKCGVAKYPGVYARVGAPALRAYAVDPAPASMPTLPADPRAPGAAPSITGTVTSGATLTCQPGSWSGATSFAYSMWWDLDGDGAHGANETLTSNIPTYRVNTSDVNAARRSQVKVFCLVKARGAGGYATASGSSELPVQVPVVLDPRAGVPTPGPTPTVAVDRIAPLLTKRAAVCSSRSCRVSVLAADRGFGATGIRALAATLTIARRSTCVVRSGKDRGRRRACTKTVRERVRFARSGSTWVASIRGLRRTDRLSLKVAAADHASNRTVLTIKLKLRSR